MRVPMVLCNYRFHSHSEWSFMRSGAKGFDVFYEGRSAVTAVANFMGDFPFKPTFLQLD